MTFMPWLPASYTCGRRTRKPPAGARSKEVRKPKAQRQRHKKAFPASHSFPAYRHATGTMHTSLPRLTLPDTYGLASHAAFRCPHRHARYADLALRRILTTRLAHSVQAFAAYRLLMCRMFIWSRQYTHQRHAGYNSAPQPIRTRHISDARIMHPRFYANVCSFVRHCLRGPAYVSSIRCAYSLTAGEGRRPFEPRKAQRQEKR